MTEREMDFRKICENNYDPIHVADGQGTILFVNEAYTRITGIAPCQVVGRNIIDVEREGSAITDLFLTGPTNIVAKGEVTDEDLSFES